MYTHFLFIKSIVLWLSYRYSVSPSADDIDLETRGDTEAGPDLGIDVISSSRSTHGNTWPTCLCTRKARDYKCDLRTVNIVIWAFKVWLQDHEHVIVPFSGMLLCVVWFDLACTSSFAQLALKVNNEYQLIQSLKSTETIFAMAVSKNRWYNSYHHCMLLCNYTAMYMN